MKYSESEIKNDNFTVKLSFLFNSENSVIHSYLYNNNISLQSVGEDCVISDGLKRILVLQKGWGTSSASYNMDYLIR